MVKRTHQIIWIVFALFVIYLALVRAVITWAQYAPEQVSSAIEWITDSDIFFETLQIEQGWFSVEVEVKEVLVEFQGLEIEASQVSFDFNLFSPLVPRARWGDALTIQELAVLEYGLPSPEGEEAVETELNVGRLLSFNAQNLTTKIDLSRLWRKVDVSGLTAAIYQQEVAWKVNVDRLQAFKGARWSLAADFNIRYGKVLQGERFQVKASLLPTIFGGIESGDFTIKSYDAIGLKRLAKLTPDKWRLVLPDGELIPNVQGRISKSLLSNLSLELNASALKWPNPEAGLPKSVGVNLEWLNQAKIYDGSQANWRFLVSQVQLDEHFIHTASPVKVQMLSSQILHIEADEFDLQPFKPIVKAILHNEGIVQLFDASAELTLKNVVADIAVPELFFESIDVDIANLAVPVTSLPGLALQNLHINKTASNIKVTTDKPVWVMYPVVHHMPMRFDFESDLNAKLDLVSGTWELETLKLNWDKMPFSLTGSGDFAGKLQLNSEIEPKTVAKVKEYLPYLLMPELLQSWLKSALVSGEQVKGEFYFEGDMNDFPFETGDTQFGGGVELKNATLEFDKDWPALKGFDATLNWSQFDLNITANKADLIAGVVAKDILVNVGPLNADDMAVEFSAQASGESVAAIDYLLSSPLPKELELDEMLADKDKIDLKGAVEVGLSRVWIPVSGFEDQEVLVDGTVKVKEANLTLFNALNYQEVAGLLKFSQDGINAEKFTARFEGGKAEFSANTKKDIITISGSGVAEVDQASIVKGLANWSAEALIPIKPSKQAVTTVNVQIDSDKLDWLMPAPLDNKMLRGRLNSSITFDKEDIYLKGQISGLGDFDIYLNNGEVLTLSKGLINLGVEKEQLGSNSGLKVSGSLPFIDLDEWVTWDMPIQDGVESSADFIKNIQWQDSNIRFDRVEFIDHIYREVGVSWQNRFADEFMAKVQSKQVSASLRLQPDSQFDVDLDWLHITLPINSTDSGMDSEQRKALVEACKIKPVQNFIWPAMSFKGKDISIDQVGVSNLTFTVSDDKERLHFKDVKAYLDGGAGVVTGDYYFYKQKNLSNANVRVSSQNVKSLTELLGLKQGFTGKAAELESSVTWPGGLECFNLQGLLGKTSYRVTDGAIEDVEPGLARLLGLLNIQSLARRLSLNLKDLTGKGFIYDYIKGQTHFLNGKLNMTEFKLKAPSASVQLKGDINLIEQTFNLKTTVIPSVGSSLPALSALTGVVSPIGALAVYAFLKVIPEFNEELVKYSYSVTGPWSAPIIDDGRASEATVEESTFGDLLGLDWEL